MKHSTIKIITTAIFVFMILMTTAQGQKVLKKTKSITNNKPTVSQIDTKVDITEFEKSILQEINELRNNPQKYVEYLEEYKKLLDGNTIVFPGNVRIKTMEGAPAIDEAIDDLKNKSPINSLVFSAGLSKVADEQLKELEKSDTEGSKKRTSLNLRLSKFGTVSGNYAENISFGSNDARRVILTMIISDGLKSRSLRNNILNPEFNVAGISCNKNGEIQGYCVVEFANSFTEKEKSPGAIRIS